MIDPHEQYDDGQILDLLVDGELDPERRRGILRRLEEEPEGWRWCALTFLEAQVFREELGSISLKAGRASLEASREHTKRLRERSLRWTTVLSLAAALVLSFWLGYSWSGASAHRGREAGMAGIPPGPSQDAGRPVEVANLSPHPGDRGDPSHRRVTLRVTTGENGGEVQVPLLEVSEADAAWQWLEEALLTEEMVASLAAAGHRVLERRHFVPLVLDDGRQAVLPINEVEVHPVSYRTYH